MKDFLGKFLTTFLVLSFIVAFGGVMEYVQKSSHQVEVVEVEDEEVIVKKIKRTPASVQKNRDSIAAPSERGLSRSSLNDHGPTAGFDGRGMEPMGGDVEHTSSAGPGAPVEGGYVPDSYVPQNYGSAGRIRSTARSSASSTKASSGSKSGATTSSGAKSSGITSTIIPGARKATTTPPTVAPTPSSPPRSSSSSGSSNPVPTNPVLNDQPPVASTSTIADFDEDTQSALITLNYTDAENNNAESCLVSNLTNITVTQACACGLGICSLRVQGSPNYHGTASYRFTVMANGKLSNEVTQTMTILPVNDAPVISGLADSSTNEDQTAFVNFTITDVDSTLTCSGSVSATSSNTTLLPNSSIVINGTAPNCTATITPAADQYGATNLEFTVTDTFLSDSETIAFQVNQLDDEALSGATYRFLASDLTNYNTNSLIQYISDKAILRPLNQTDDASGFAAGTAYGIVYDADIAALKMSNAGGCNPYQSQDIYARLQNYFADAQAAYFLDGAIGAIADTQNMVTLGGPTLTAEGTGLNFQNGRHDEAVKFANNSRLISNPHGPLHRVDGQGMTLMAWIKPSFNGSNYQQIIANRPMDSVYNWMLYQHLGGELSFHGASQFKSNYVPLNDVWIHVTVTVSTSGVSKLFVNGDLKHTESSYLYAQAGVAERLVVGGQGNATEDFFDGSIDDLFYFTSAIPDADVRVVYDQASMKYHRSMNGTIADCLRLRESWTPKTEKIIGYWRMENVNTANGSILTAVAGPDLVVTNSGNNLAVAEGKLGSAIEFKSLSASNNSLRSSDTQFGNFGTRDFTIQFWASFANSSVNQYIMSKRSVCTNDSFYSIQYENDGRIVMELDNDVSGSNYHILTSNSTVPSNKWTMLTVTRQGGVAKIYLNGVEDGSVSFPASKSLSNNSPFEVGSSICPANSFNGKLDELSVWEAALSATEIKQIYERQSAGFSDSSRQGVFISRVFETPNAQSWTSIIMETLAPFGKELTRTNESASNYPDAETNLMNNILAFWHFEENAYAEDRGPYGYHMSGYGAVDYQQKGKLGKAARFRGTSYSTPAYMLGNLDTSAMGNHYTISAWVTRSSVQEWATIFSANVNTTGAASLSMIGTGNTIGMNNVGAGSENVAVDLGADSFNKWIFVTARMNAGTLTIDAWMDGIHQTASATVAFGVNNTAGQAYIGRHFTLDGQYWSGMIDEVGVWGRSLSNNEILELYRRGASRTKIQIKHCTTASCADAEWKGPDNTSNTYFSELNNNSAQAAANAHAQDGSLNLNFSNFTGLGLALPASQYFQYRLIFETDSTLAADSPNVNGMSIGPVHYPIAAPYVQHSTGFDYLSLSSLAVTANCSGLRLQLSQDNGASWMWYSGSAWVASNGSYAETSDLSTVQSNIVSFPGSGHLRWRAFMGSSGSTACELEQFTFDGGI